MPCSCPGPSFAHLEGSVCVSPAQPSGSLLGGMSPTGRRSQSRTDGGRKEEKDRGGRRQMEKVRGGGGRKTKEKEGGSFVFLLEQELSTSQVGCEMKG